MGQLSKYHQTKDQIAEEEAYIRKSQKTPEAFKFLYDKYFEQILIYIYNRLDDKDLAVDITQQVFLKALRNIGKYKILGLPFSSWLYRIASNELNETFRKNSKLRTINLNDTIVSGLQAEMEDEQKSEWLLKLKSLLRRLKEADLRLIELRFFEDRPFKEIAEILDITENNAKVKTYRVLDKMKAMLAETN